MHFAQYYLECLSQASYLIGDRTTGRAVVVDPRRDISEYLDDARTHGLTIEGVVNTHFHADFIAGHLEMAEATGAWIGYGRRAAEVEYPIRRLLDGERISLGDVTLEVLETPGHTPESISLLVYEHPEDDVAYGVLTGDALFIGDVGRPDLLTGTGSHRRLGAHPPGGAAQAARRAADRPADRRLLRPGKSLRDGGQPATPCRIRGRERPARRLSGLATGARRPGSATEWIRVLKGGGHVRCPHRGAELLPG